MCISLNQPNTSIPLWIIIGYKAPDKSFINNDFSYFLSLALLKGDTYVPTWGISLKFGHKVNRDNLKDLIYDPVDYFKPFTEWTLPMSTYNWKDLDTFSRRAKELSEKSCKAAKEYLSRIDTINDLVQHYKWAEEYKEYKRFNFYNYPLQVVSYAFVLKKAGDEITARKYLQIYFDKYKIDNDTKQKLTSEFDSF